MNDIGYIKNPFSSFNKKTKLGFTKSKCYGCDGCKYELYSFATYPCSVCSHNIRTKGTGAPNRYEKK